MQPNLLQPLKAAYQRLKQQPTLQPGPVVDAQFNTLVHHATQALPPAETASLLQHIDTDIGLAELRWLCAQGEAEMERAWAKQLAVSPDPLATLAGFPYFENYQRLVAAEVNLLRRFNPGLQSVLLVGSGPLPLTAYFMAQDYGLDVLCLDYDAEANQLAANWLQRLPVAPRLGWLQADINTLAQMPAVEAIWVGAMVLGATEAAAQTTMHTLQHKVRAGQYVGVRSTHGLRQLLYTKIDCRSCHALTYLGVFHPQDDVVNSFIVLQKPLLSIPASGTAGCLCCP